jgi:hypothetical protein
VIPRLLGRASAKLQRDRSLAVVGGASLALAVGVAFVPWLFPADAFRPLSVTLASPAAILLVAGVIGLLGVQALRRSAAPESDEGDDDHRVRWTPAKEPERAFYEEYRTTGDEIDSVFGANPDDERQLGSHRRTARKRIRRTAITVVADAERIDEERAAERIADGSWTDDPRAAAFLGGRRFAPLRTRIRDWASGERFERWATRAVEAIDAIDRGEATSSVERTEIGEFEGGHEAFDTEIDGLAGETDGVGPETDGEREVAR